MDDDTKRLVRADLELSAGKEALREERKRVHKLKRGTLREENAKRSLRTLEAGVKSIKAERELLVEKLKKESL
jgi:hypothetical protein